MRHDPNWRCVHPPVFFFSLLNRHLFAKITETIIFRGRRTTEKSSEVTRSSCATSKTCTPTRPERLHTMSHQHMIKRTESAPDRVEESWSLGFAAKLLPAMFSRLRSTKTDAVSPEKQPAQKSARMPPIATPRHSPPMLVVPSPRELAFHSGSVRGSVTQDRTDLLAVRPRVGVDLLREAAERSEMDGGSTHSPASTNSPASGSWPANSPASSAISPSFRRIRSLEAPPPHSFSSKQTLGSNRPDNQPPALSSAAARREFRRKLLSSENPAARSLDRIRFGADVILSLTEEGAWPADGAERPPVGHTRPPASSLTRVASEPPPHSHNAEHATSSRLAAWRDDVAASPLSPTQVQMRDARPWQNLGDVRRKKANSTRMKLGS